MARLYEYQGKELLRQAGLAVPRGGPARTPDEARACAMEINGPVVLKAQVFVTGRAGAGGIRFAETPDEAAAVAAEMLGAEVKGQKVADVLVEEKLDITREMYAGVIVDDAAKKPLLIFASEGGTGIEEIAAENPGKVVRRHIDINQGFRTYDGINVAREAGLTGKILTRVGHALVGLWETARRYEARAAEINPLVVSAGGDLVAADCRITIDDYAVYRHPELGIEVAREFDKPPTKLDIIAYNVEKDDYRGTFYFVQLERGYGRGDGYVGFHGAGGGGSMMSMDAVLAEGFNLANFCDTSGNPPASKVYRAAKIIFAQGPIDAYFGSGSGVASQEQFHSARGLVKAFREAWLDIPAVVRLGGNQEDLAVQILTEYTKDLPARVEGYKKDDPASFCARRLRELVDAWDYSKKYERPPAEPHDASYSFTTVTNGTVSYDYSKCRACETKVCISTCVQNILDLDKEGCPRLNITLEDAAKGKCSECLACEVECYAKGNGGGKIILPIPGLSSADKR